MNVAVRSNDRFVTVDHHSGQWRESAIASNTASMGA